MRKKLHTFFILISLFSCKDPGIQQEFPLQIFYNNWPNTNAAAILDPLNILILNAQESIECAFSDVDNPYPLDLEPLSKPYQKTIYVIAESILTKRNQGISTSLIFNSKQKCTSTGALYFQYPGAYSSTASGITVQDIMSDCNGIGNEYARNMKTGALKETIQGEFNPEISFVNNSGEMMDNLCLIDKNKIWVSSSPLNATLIHMPSFSFLLEMEKNPMANEFINELELLRNKLSGSLKKSFWNPVVYELSNTKWQILRGPQNNPVEYLTKQIQTATNLNIFSTSFAFSDTGFSNALSNRITDRKNTKMIFTGTSIFESNSFVNRFFYNSGFCQNDPDYCKENLLYANSFPNNHSEHFFLFTDSNDVKKIIIFNGSLNSTGTVKDDSMLIEIESDEVYGHFEDVWNSIYENTRPVVEYAPIPDTGEVIINEIVWMGSITNSRKKQTSDKAMELYNPTNKSFEISGLIIACTDSGNSANDLFSIPEGVTIQPHQYFTMASNRDAAFGNANIIIPDLSISNTTSECILIDNRTPVTQFRPAASTAGHYFDSRLKGKIIDRVLDYAGNPVNLYASDFFSKTGLNTLKYNIAEEGVRSMEKNSSGLDGTNLSSWHMNTLSPMSSNLPAEYVYHTFATFGYENSPAPEKSDGSVIINEVHWMGAYDSTGTSFSQNEFVEIYNRSLSPKNIGGWTFGCSMDIAGAVGAPLFAFPFGTIIYPNQYMVIQKNGASAFLKFDFTFDFTLSNSITQCLLSDGDFNARDFTGTDSNANGYLDGNYDHPLFAGSVVDSVSDRSASLSSLSLGINDTAGKIRRSCERISPDLPGNLRSSWKANSLLDPILNTDIDFNFRYNTFATPGSPNSF